MPLCNVKEEKGGKENGKENGFWNNADLVSVNNHVYVGI